MKNLIFDTSSIISIVTNDLLNVLVRLKEKFDGEFFVTKEVKREMIDYPITSKKFKLEALVLEKFMKDKQIKLYHNLNLENKSKKLLELANNIFLANNNYIQITHMGEIESLSLCVILKGVFVVDERTVRMLVENYKNLQKLLSNKLHTKIEVNEKNLKLFLDEVKGVKIIRSSELMTVAFELGLFDEYEKKKELLDGLLWGLRLRGCAISSEEINRIESLFN
ncbi:MAG: hypothetical protein KJ674_03535 [Nanoarchaeota archaeon]|nr:hypothetical protein [Nanoarchaeota archaeon]